MTSVVGQEPDAGRRDPRPARAAPQPPGPSARHGTRRRKARETHLLALTQPEDDVAA